MNDRRSLMISIMLFLVVALEDVVVDGENKMFPFFHLCGTRKDWNECIFNSIFESTLITVNLGLLCHVKMHAEFVELGGVLEGRSGLTKTVKLHHRGRLNVWV
ncbi:hypothetical protein DFH06DRAFT_1205618 [Mycena polygramma]|nr:hypothetical protein DFH06DRAFT_1205618 [Mycena polygramma]